MNFRIYRKTQKIHLLQITLFVILLFSLSTSHAKTNQDNMTDEAEQLIDSAKKSILQIRVIEKTTNKKSSIGSGFYVSSSGMIATNYHVVSSVVQSPDNYHLEYLDYQGNSGLLSLIAVDVVHDLAIVVTNDTQGQDKSLRLAEKGAAQGEKIFSLGNPHDLGLTIVEGINNGLLEKARNEKVHFTGSLNPGMSGGPTVNRSGEVVGVNVSTAGNQISFLVPGKFLSLLISKSQAQSNAGVNNFDEIIEQQLFKEQQIFFSNLLKAQWPKENIGNLNLPAEISGQIKCWGNSNTEEERLVNRSFINCSSEDRIFISRDFDTGQLQYSYVNVHNRDLLTLRFYEIYQAGLSVSRPVNLITDEYVSEFKCHSDFIQVIERSWRVHTCARRYKKYPLLYDLVVDMTMVGEKAHGAIISLNVSGIGKEMSQQLTERFFREISWQP
ncbi:MAG: serine protease [Gammaproteobacteria bacterium]|nr:serine protease [Gammaproteobacteria bacterium]